MAKIFLKEKIFSALGQIHKKNAIDPSSGIPLSSLQEKAPATIAIK